MADATGLSIVNAPPPGERLTPRARAYLWIAAWRHGTVGLSLILWPQLFNGPAFGAMKNALPVNSTAALAVWGSIFLAASLFSAYAATVARENPARVALIVSIMSSLIWAGGFASATYDGAKLSPIGLIFAIALAAKDLTMLRDPLRNPFEPLLNKVLGDAAAASRAKAGTHG